MFQTKPAFYGNYFKSCNKFHIILLCTVIHTYILCGAMHRQTQSIPGGARGRKGSSTPSSPSVAPPCILGWKVSLQQHFNYYHKKLSKRGGGSHLSRGSTLISSSLASKSLNWVDVINNGKHSSLLRYGKSYCRKKFYSTGPWISKQKSSLL